MNSDEYNRIRNPTIVTTRIITRDNGSRYSPTVGLKLPIAIQCHKVIWKTCPTGGASMKPMPMNEVTIADRATDPTPMIPTARCGNPPPLIISMTEPRSGNAGTSQRVCNITLSLQQIGCVGIQRGQAMAYPDDQCQADGNFRCCQGQHEHEHDLAIRLPPAGAGDDEGETR